MQQLTYTQYGDYFFPDIILRESLLENAEPLRKYGFMRLTFLQNHRHILYNRLVLTEELFPHLRDIQSIAGNRLETMMIQLIERDPPPDKELDGLAWAAHMNMLNHIAEENILTELIYK